MPLAPCPRCKSVPGPQLKLHGLKNFVQCNQCLYDSVAEVGVFPTPELAASSWNGLMPTAKVEPLVPRRANEWKVGDVVTLRSGSPSLTVTEVGPARVKVQWFSRGAEGWILREASIPVEVIDAKDPAAVREFMAVMQ